MEGTDSSNSTPTNHHNNHTTHTNSKMGEETMAEVEDMAEVEEDAIDTDNEANEAVVKIKSHPTPM